MWAVMKKKKRYLVNTAEIGFPFVLCHVWITQEFDIVRGDAEIKVWEVNIALSEWV